MGKLTEFRTDSDYRLWLRFDDGLEGSVFLGNMIEMLDAALAKQSGASSQIVSPQSNR